MEILCTSVCVMNEDLKVLLGKRSGTDYFPDRWSFPGGKLHPSETMEECAKREVFEEVGLVCNRLTLWDLHCNHHQDGNTYLSAIYLTIFPIGDLLNKEPHKCAELDWFSWPTELPKPLMPLIEKLLDKGLDPRSAYLWS